MTTNEGEERQSSELKAAAEELRNGGCCTRCVLRHMGCKNTDNYRSDDKAYECLNDILGGNFSSCVHNSKRERRNTCILCLGILTDLCSSEAVSNVKETVRQSNFEFSDFVLSVGIPSCCLIREHVTRAYLKNKFPSLLKISYVPSVKDVWKWIVGPPVEEEFNVPFSVTSLFEILIVIEFNDNKEECQNLNAMLHDVLNLGQSSKKKKYSEHSRGTIEKLLSTVTNEDILSCVEWPLSVPTTSAIYQKLECSRKSVFVAGRYNKYSRNLSQTPWLIDGEKLMETSVKEIICDHLIPHFQADDVKFSASGREDVDVRTLGKGRPFVLEFINARKVMFDENAMKTFQTNINNSTKDIAVRDLQIVPKEDVSNLKAGEEEKKKVYSALCFSKQPLNLSLLDELQQKRDLVLAQKTPVRVLHRRPIAVRERVVHEMKAEAVDERHFRMRLTTQAGTYIKEFVHGDFGRTVPNMTTLLESETDILELDVEAVELDWPPQVSD